MTLEFVKANKIVTFKTGKLDSNAAVEGGKYPFFTCSQTTYEINSYAFDTECVLLAGNNASAIFPLKYYKGKFNAYQRTYVIEPIDSTHLNIKYFYFFLRPFLKSFEQQATGATTKFLTIKILNNVDVALPKFEIQQKIAAILSAYDDLIENNKRRIALLEKMAEEIYREWFVRLRFPGHEKVKGVKGVPEGWEEKKLSEIVELCYGKALKAEERVSGDYPVFGSSGVVGTHNKPLVKAPGIIVGRKGNVGSVHWADCDFFPIDTAYYVKSTISLHYLFFLLQSMNFINNDAAVPGLNRNQAYSNLLLLPLDSVINEFSAKAKQLFELKDNLSKQNEQLTQTRDSLLPRLISGKLSVENLDIQFPPGMGNTPSEQ
jgi:type I restriction enzyme S subunit